ncbi:MAG: PAS domain S-box protein [Chloroflexi bacterium]|nr:PAS domain S-box protein [Chloroflexota bacterium]
MKSNRKTAPETTPPPGDSFHLLFYNHPTPMWIYDLESLAFLEANDAAVEKYGYTREEFLRLTLKDIRPQEDVARLVADVKKKRPSLQHSGEWRHHLRDGRIIDVEITSHTLEFRGRKAALVTAHDITERKQAEKNLQESETRYRSLVENISDVIYTLDLHGKFTYVSPVVERLSKYTASELIGRNFAEFIYPADLPGLLENFNQTLQGDLGSHEYRILDRDGALHYIRSSSQLDVKDGTVVGLNGIMTEITERKQADITERKQAEEALRAGRDFAEQVVNALGEGLTVTDAEGHFLYVNPAYARMVGRSPESMLGCHPADFTAPADQDRLGKERLHRINGETSTYESRLLHANGHEVPVLITAVPHQSNGAYAGSIAAISDITERKQAEDNLRKSEERFRTILDNLDDGYYEVDLKGNFTLFNPAYARYLGYRKNEMMGLNYRQYMSPETAKDVFQVFNRCYKTGLPKRIYDIELICKDGTRRFTEISVSLIKTADKGIVGFRGIVRDISERKQAEEEISKLNAELEQRVEERTRELRAAQDQLVRQEKLAVLGQLAGGVGHELRNPLGVINNAVYLLKLIQPEADKKTKEYLGMIEKETHTAEKIITDLLDFSRSLSSDREAVDVTRLIQETLERYPVPDSVAVHRRIARNLPPVLADSRQMVQVLGNLVINAFQAMPKGGRLKISAARYKEQIAIAVQDGGTGVAPENMGKLFEPLFTTKLKGIGLGLAVSKKLVEANGGRIEVQSEPGKGSTFTLFLPVDEASHG